MAKNLDLTDWLSPWFSALPMGVVLRPSVQLTLDSRQIQEGDVFVAVPGHTMDGRRFIPMAVAAKASLIFVHTDQPEEHGRFYDDGETCVLSWCGLAENISSVARRFYGYPDQAISTIAITGTNGKTTVSQLLAQWLELLGESAGVMGTTGNGRLNALKKAVNTTGSAIEIQETLAQLQQERVHWVSMEVSSHGLVQGRIAHVPFVARLFTNLSRDHLDYHGDMAHYAAAKAKLFTEFPEGVAVINADDPIGLEWLNIHSDAVWVSTHQAPEVRRQGVWATSIAYSTEGVVIHFNSSWGKGVLNVPLVGEFNVSNALLAFATLLSLGFDFNALVSSATQLRAVMGRMEVFTKPNRPMMVVDYAHTPDALEKALTALRRHCYGKLWCIVGCGGDRDKGKRPIMASIAETYADGVILTDDNPRSESPQAIIQDMLTGLAKPNAAKIIHDRAEACAWAWSNANENDIVLVAGKGHEDYQIFADKTVHYSDRETIASLIKA
jgi:UDP-N-acetylmuramoyl-L-alanyl-D-glutamate--2,6-diaminopimelate ligase